MQLQGLMIMLFFTIAIPIIIMSANHNVFFILIALVLFIVSVRDIRNILMFMKDFKSQGDYVVEDDMSDEREIVEELEDMTNINIRKFSIGISLAKSLIIILFFVYCSFYVEGLMLKALISSLILYRIYLITNLLFPKSIVTQEKPPMILYITKIAYDMISVAIIVASLYLRYLNGV